jgi:hypothetical protein
VTLPASAVWALLTSFAVKRRINIAETTNHRFLVGDCDWIEDRHVSLLCFVNMAGEITEA